MVHFQPHVAVIVQDSPEGYALCGQRMSEGAHMPCRFCWIRRAQANDPYAIAAVRTADQNRALGAPWRELAEKKGKNVGKVENELRALSLAHGENGIWGVPFGLESVQRGINGATAPDMLHQFLLGLMKMAFVFTLKAIKEHGKKKGTRSVTLRLQELDRRFSVFDTRHGDSSLPTHRFSTGVSKLTSITDSEFIPLCWQMQAALGVGPDTVLGGGHFT